MIYEMCQMSYYLLRPTPSWKCIGGVLPLKSDIIILKVKLLLYTFKMGWVLTGSETSETSCRSFLGHNNNFEMGYHLKNWKKSKLGHPNPPPPLRMDDVIFER